MDLVVEGDLDFFGENVPVWRSPTVGAWTQVVLPLKAVLPVVVVDAPLEIATGIAPSDLTRRCGVWVQADVLARDRNEGVAEADVWIDALFVKGKVRGPPKV